MGEAELGIRLLEIIALLLPLTGIFLQALLRVAASDRDIDIEPLALGVGYTVVFLVGASLAAAIAIEIPSRSLPVTVGYTLLLAALVFVGVLVLQFAVALVDNTEEPIPAVEYVGPPRSYLPREDDDADE